MKISREEIKSNYLKALAHQMGLQSLDKVDSFNSDPTGSSRPDWNLTVYRLSPHLMFVEDNASGTLFECLPSVSGVSLLRDFYLGLISEDDLEVAGIYSL